ncbi:MAGE family-domain-containing protein [Rhodocollybia butyracea]|uniref:MAGE family-domain-containing protein n=1 Tax=Rhodocollybia butyracea TaxID=206335 RepID=A0A9P5QBT9_9AGAR|nr:MAGE family-domain-containing protein [Rhodocollybia butyracea]
MAKGNTSTYARSQRTSTRASQSQTQTQQKSRSRAQRVDSDDEDADSDADENANGNDDGEAMEVDGGGGASQESVDVNLKANQLVRLALFMEHRRLPLKRDEISKKVLGPSSRASRSFNRVFEQAQFILNRTFGLELAELHSRDAMERAAAAADPSLNEEQEDEDEEATQGKRKGKAAKKKAPTGSKNYILRSILDPTIISFASLPDEEILNAELEDMPDLDDDENGSPPPARTQGGRSRRSQSTTNSSVPACTGTLLSFSSSALPALENPGALGILHVVLSLILVSGRLMGDRDLRAALRQLHLPTGAGVPLGRSAHLSGNSGNMNMTIDTYLQHLIRQGYLDRFMVGEAGKAAKAGKRGRTSTAAGNDDEEGNKYEWRWGIRAQSEIGEKAVAEFIAEFMVGTNGGDGQDVGGSRRANGRGSDSGTKLKKMLDGIEKAAGGNVADLK